MTQYMKAEGNLLECYETLNSKGFVIPDAERFAELRVTDAREKGSWKRSEVCRNGARMTNGIVYDGKDVLVTDGAHNPIMKNIREAVKAHSEGKEFTLDNITIEELRDLAKTNPEDAIKTGVLLLTDREDIPTGKLANRQYGQFLFGKQAETYAGLCQESDTNVIPVYLAPEGDVKKVGKPFGRVLWVCGLGRRGSLLDGYDMVLHIKECRAFGVPSKEGIEAHLGAK